MIQMQFDETNPYKEEVLVSTAPQLQEKEAARKDILQAVWNLDFIENYAREVLAVLIARQQGANTTNTQDPTFGQFGLNILNSPAGMANRSGVFLRKDGNNNQLVVAPDNQAQITPELLDALGVPYEEQSVELNGQNQQVLILEDLFSNHDDSFALNDYRVTDNRKIEARRQAESSIVELVEGQRTYFDIARLLRENPVLSRLPIDKAIEYHLGLKAIVSTGNRLFAEQEVGGLAESNIQEQLYGLPFKTNMWKSWQYYLVSFVQSTRYLFGSQRLWNARRITDLAQQAGLTSGARDYDPQAALVSLTSNPNWPVPGAVADSFSAVEGPVLPGWDGVLTTEEQKLLREVANQWYGPGGSPTGALLAVTEKPFDYLIGLATASVSSGTEVADIYEHAHSVAIQRLVNRYMRNFPLQIALPERLKSQYNFLLGDLLGNLTDERNKVPALESMYDSLYANAYSCGNITSAVDGNP